MLNAFYRRIKECARTFLFLFVASLYLEIYYDIIAAMFSSGISDAFCGAVTGAGREIFYIIVKCSALRSARGEIERDSTFRP
jgi:hypothetical protein